MTIRDLLTSDLEFAFADLGRSVTINAVDYACEVSTISTEALFKKFGTVSGYEFSITMIRPDTPPSNRDLVTLDDGKEYRIWEQELDSAGIGLILHLQAKNVRR